MAGELARYLLGRVESPENEAIKKIAEAFNISLGILKEDKEAKTHMNVVDKYLAEGEVIGLEKSLAILRAIKDSYSDDRIAEHFNVTLEQVSMLRSAV